MVLIVVAVSGTYRLFKSFTCCVICEFWQKYLCKVYWVFLIKNLFVRLSKFGTHSAICCMRFYLYDKSYRVKRVLCNPLLTLIITTIYNLQLDNLLLWTYIFTKMHVYGSPGIIIIVLKLDLNENLANVINISSLKKTWMYPYFTCKHCFLTPSSFKSSHSKQILFPSGGK